MSANISSQFDRLLKAIDAIVHKGMSSVTGEDAAPFQISASQWASHQDHPAIRVRQGRKTVE
jgi:hypothetical protein